MNKNNKRKLLTCGILLSLLLNHNVEYQDIPNYGINEENHYFKTYSLGKIYIGKYSFLKEIKDEINENDIVVIDQRNSKDPNMKIYNSAYISDEKIINEVLEALLEYETLYPSNWDRSIDSMKIEWAMHNISYYFDYEKKRTRDVDFNNSDEDYYNNIWYGKFLNF
jgi:hypothetical protein